VITGTISAMSFVLIASGFALIVYIAHLVRAPRGDGSDDTAPGSPPPDRPLEGASWPPRSL